MQPYIFPLFIFDWSLIRRITENINNIMNRCRPTPTIHNYTIYSYGKDYIFETTEEGECYLTGQGNIKSGDQILIKVPGNPSPQRYKVELVEFFSNAPNMWQALITEVPNN